MRDRPKSPMTWNKNFAFADNDVRFWQIGPLRIWAAAHATEIRLAFVRGEDPPEGTLLVEETRGRVEPPDGAEVRRFGFRQPPTSLKLVPALADRPVVVSPEDPLMLPPGEETTVFVSTPLWVKVAAGNTDTVLIDEPTFRPSDSWFGPSTMEGELCYATKTNARMNLKNLPVRPHRAISVVHVKNDAISDLNIEKLKLPAPQMSVYVTARGHLWTEGVTLQRHEEGQPATVRLGQGPPDPAPDATLAAGPRSPLQRNVLTRAFASVLR